MRTVLYRIIPTMGRNAKDKKNHSHILTLPPSTPLNLLSCSLDKVEEVAEAEAVLATLTVEVTAAVVATNIPPREGAAAGLGPLLTVKEGVIKVPSTPPLLPYPIPYSPL